MRYDSHYLPSQWMKDNFEIQLDEPGHESLNVDIVAIYIVLALALTQHGHDSNRFQNQHFVV